MNQPARLRVLESFRTPGPQTNPYITTLLAHLQQQCEVTTFSWGAALRGQYDVVHLHWPEVLLSANSRSGRAAKRLLFAAWLQRLRSKRIVVVRTVHNLAPHEAQVAADERLLRKLDHRVNAYVRINDQSVTARPERTITILHGDYQQWAADFPQQSAHPQSMASVGFIRGYKGVPQLLEAFRSLALPSARLTVAGGCRTPEIEAEVRAAAGSDERIDLRLQFQSDADLVDIVTASSVVVLPYQHLHNSGVALLALSLNRPVLVPDNEATAALADEVGQSWVHRFTPPLAADDLERALAVSSTLPIESPNLQARDWATGTRRLVDLFTRLVRDPSCPVEGDTADV